MKYSIGALHFCPICSETYREDPVDSIIIADTEICPSCAANERKYYGRFLSYHTLIRRLGVTASLPLFN